MPGVRQILPLKVGVDVGHLAPGLPRGLGAVQSLEEIEPGVQQRDQFEVIVVAESVDGQQGAPFIQSDEVVGEVASRRLHDESIDRGDAGRLGEQRDLGADGCGCREIATRAGE